MTPKIAAALALIASRRIARAAKRIRRRQTTPTLPVAKSPEPVNTTPVYPHVDVEVRPTGVEVHPVDVAVQVELTSRVSPAVQGQSALPESPVVDAPLADIAAVIDSASAPKKSKKKKKKDTVSTENVAVTASV